jgi:glutamate--cysteine ligase
MDEINSKQDLINFFENGCKKESEINIGVEHERFIFEKNSNRRINFETTSKILNFLTKFGWKTIEENKNVVALSRNRQKITLEPGNQIELSGAKLNSIHLVCEESYKFLNELKRACSNFNLKMMSVSYDPLTNLEKVPKTPKQRYEIMTEEMPKNGKLSLHMMYQTCGTQINLDYTSEKDFIKKFKLSSFFFFFSIGIFANSPIKENKLSGYLSYRSKVWQNTSRAGLPKIFLENLDFEKYTDMAINMPLLFVLNNSNYLKGEGKTFKDFMEGKLETLNNRKPNIKDFDNHLTTIFTEIRLKRFIEIRSLDTCEWDCHCSGPAFYTGLLYGSLNEAFDIINKWNVIEVLNAYKDVPKKGLNTIINNKTLLEWGKIFLELARDGLEKRSIKNNTGKDESIFLRNIENILNNNKTRAFVTIEKFKNNNNLEFLYEKN